MSAVYPFSLPWPSVGYVVLYVATLLLHAVFMSYVLAGVLTVAIAKVRGLLRGTKAGPITTVLIDWLPFALSAAITAGIAPLLFVQILYQEAFYTANLLLFHRWMAILPVLIVAFYLLYVLKAKSVAPRLSAAVAVAIAGAIMFVGWSWVENHLLSLDRAAWVDHYAKGSMVYGDPSVFARFGFWVLAAIPTSAHLLLRQLKAGASGVDASAAAGHARVLAPAAALSLLGVVALASPILQGRWALFQPPTTEVSGAIQLWLAVGAVGALLQLVTWVFAWRGAGGSPWGLRLGSVGLIAFWWGILSAREAVRAATLGSAEALARHSRVATTSGLVVFLVFALIAVGAVVWIARQVRAGLARDSA